MIRPFTCVCVLLAAGSGLYLYQTKHRTLMLDQQIADVLKQADAARARTTVLKAEYTTLSEPGRLAELSDRFLALKPSAPTQYVQLAALDEHLPPVESFPKPGEAPAPPPAGATDTDADAPDDQAASVVAAAAPAVDAAPTDAKLPVAAPRAVASAAPLPHLGGEPQTTTPHDGARVAQAALPAPPHPARHVSLPSSQYASNLHAQPMPMAAPRPVQSAVLATAALRPAGSPARPRITNAGYAAYAPPARGVLRPAASSAMGGGGSMLGASTTIALAPPVPVPVAN